MPTRFSSVRPLAVLGVVITFSVLCLCGSIGALVVAFVCARQPSHSNGGSTRRSEVQMRHAAYDEAEMRTDSYDQGDIGHASVMHDSRYIDAYHIKAKPSAAADETPYKGMRITEY